MKIIGFTGRRGRGKDTAADYLVSGYGFTKYAFAMPLKRGVQEWFDFTDDQIFTDEKEKIDQHWGISPREILQKMGTEVMREMLPKLFQDELQRENLQNFWIRRAEKWLTKQKIYNSNVLVVVSDVRFQNEVDWINKNGGKVYRIVRPCLDVKDITKTDLHLSETSSDSLENVEKTIVNDTNIEFLYDSLDRIMGNIRF